MQYTESRERSTGWLPAAADRAVAPQSRAQLDERCKPCCGISVRRRLRPGTYRVTIQLGGDRIVLPSIDAGLRRNATGP